MILTNATALAAVNAIVDRVDQGSGAGKLKIYSGTPPADADTALAGNTLLAELTMSDPAFGDAADGTGSAVATANSITGDTSADASGTATFARLTDSDDNVLWQGTVGTSGADVNLDSVTIVALGEVNVTSMTVTLSES